MVEVNEHGQTFGEWLFSLRQATGALAEVLKAARSDPQFPRRGSPDEVRGRLNAMQADGDLHDAIDDAETDWQSY